MAVVTLQFGQCGNQVGLELFSSIFKDIENTKPGVSAHHNSDYVKHCAEQWFEQDKEKSRLTARAVLVDTESKVVNELLRRSASNAKWIFNSQQTAVKSGGAGNNWALGYQKRGPELYDTVSESLRFFVEKTDRLNCILSMMSSAGGTGSGVGSYIVESLRDEYPRKIFLNTVVLPYENGEVVTQSYNTLLTLAKVYNVCDATLLFQNDHLHKMLLTLLNLKTVSIEDLNSLITQKMAGLLQPVETIGSSRPLVSDVICHLASHPAFKFFIIRSAPHIPKGSKRFEVGHQWSIIPKHFRQMLRKNSLTPEAPVLDWELKPLSSFPAHEHSLQQYSSSIANALVTRGTQNHSQPKTSEELRDPVLYPNWIPQGSGLLECHENRRFNDNDKFAVLATNNSQISCPLDRIIEKAWKMFTHKAYIHQYTRFGLMEEDFVDSFVKIESVIKAYKELNKN